MTAQDLHIVITVVSFFTFIGIVWWAYSAPRKAAFDAAEAIMTTDHMPKLSAFAWHENGKRYTVGGIAKGSGMIAPNKLPKCGIPLLCIPVRIRAIALQRKQG